MKMLDLSKFRHDHIVNDYLRIYEALCVLENSIEQWNDFSLAYEFHVTQTVDVALHRLGQNITLDISAKQIKSKREFVEQIQLAKSKILYVIDTIAKYEL